MVYDGTQNTVNSQGFNITCEATVDSTDTKADWEAAVNAKGRYVHLGDAVTGSDFRKVKLSGNGTTDLLFGGLVSFDVDPRDNTKYICGINLAAADAYAEGTATGAINAAQTVVVGADGKLTQVATGSLAVTPKVIGGTKAALRISYNSLGL